MHKPDLSLFIADDDADDRDFLSDALLKKGFTGNISGFENGADLIAQLVEKPAPVPDLIVLDLNMPVKNGYETLKELKTNHQLQMIPVIVITSSSKAEDEFACFTLGCNKFFRKPISLNGYTALAADIISFANAV